jgi:hypothetical protein
MTRTAHTMIRALRKACRRSTIARLAFALDEVSDAHDPTSGVRGGDIKSHGEARLNLLTIRRSILFDFVCCTLAKNRGVDVDVDLALGVFSERVPLHGGFELNTFQQGEGIDVAEDVANDWEPVG